MFENVIKHYPDFPKPGIDFIDVLPFLQDKEAFRQAVNEKTLVPFRKKGKLPHAEGDLVRVEIEKEYGSDELFYRLSDFAACEATGDYIDITLFDDLLATGGTVKGIVDSLQQQTIDGKKIRIKEFIFLVELPALGGRKLLEGVAPVHALMRLEGVE